MSLDSLWAPWRGEYIKKAMGSEESTDNCVLCNAPCEEDCKKALVLHSGRYNYIIMNLYPYNLGHVMVVPHEHVNAVDCLSDEVRNEHYMLVARAAKVLRSFFKCEGFNIGMNMGRSGGAGIDQHIHTHIVPRWNGDTNFMPIIADTKVMSSTLFEVYDGLKESFDGYK